MERFISEDKMQINLPVSLGSVVYRWNTRCCDACTFQEWLFRKNFEDHSGCSACPCHTRFAGSDSVVLSLSNLEFVLAKWGSRYFATKDEADKAGLAFVQQNIAFVKSLGFELNERGYSIVKEDASNENIN